VPTPCPFVHLRQSSAPGLPWCERLTGLTGTAIVLAQSPRLNPNITRPSPFRLTKNGLLLDPAGGAGGYTLAGNTVTLGSAAIVGDVFVADFWYALDPNPFS
jgi:hypothetical protein